jgi:hypothetical protein
MLVLAVAVALGLTACGETQTVTQAAAGATTASMPTTSASRSATTSATMTRAEAGRAYLAAVAPANTELVAFKAKASSWNHSTPPRHAANDAGPLISAITALRTKLLALANAYPPAADDLSNLVTANAGLQRDLAKLESLNKLNAGVWILQFAADADASHAAVVSVRFDLGLPEPQDGLNVPSSGDGTA